MDKVEGMIIKQADVYFSRFLKYGTLLSAVILIAIVIIQIYARFLMEKAPAWTEELSRMVFIYSVSFASGLALRQNYFVRLDLWHSRQNKRFNLALKVLSNITALILFGIFLVCSVQFLKMGLAERSPGLTILMIWSFGAMLLMGISMTLFILRDLIYQIRRSL